MLSKTDLRWKKARQLKLDLMEKERARFAKELEAKRTDLEEMQQKVDHLDRQTTVLEIVNKVKDNEDEKIIHAYLVEGEIVEELKKLSSKLHQAAIHLETRDISYGWEMEMVHGHHEWLEWDDDPCFEEKRGAMLRNKLLPSSDDVWIHSDYLDTEVDADDDFEDSTDTGKRTIALFIKTGIGLITTKKNWKALLRLHTQTVSEENPESEEI